VTNTGSTTIYGSVGVDPGSAITGFPPGVVTGGSIYGPGGVSNLAQSAALNGYNTLKALPYPGANDLTGQDLGTVGTLVPGVYHFDTTAQLTGTLTLDFASNPAGDFIFQIGTALTTASGSVVNVINGSSLSGVYWQVGSSATLGTSTMFAGNILADQSITLNTAADILCGRAFALNGSVTLIDNLISNNNFLEDFGSGRSDFGSYGFSGGETPVIPVPGAFLLACSGMGSLFAFGRRFFSRS
jgi:type VI secretion system secreted protein VgrG